MTNHLSPKFPKLGFRNACRVGTGVPLVSDLEDGRYYLLLQSAMDSRRECEPDLFSGPFPDGSGQFIFGNNEHCSHCLSCSPVRIKSGFGSFGAQHATGQFDIISLTGAVGGCPLFCSTTLRLVCPAWKISTFLKERLALRPVFA